MAEHDDKDGLQSFTMSKALELLHSEISAEVRHHKQMKCDQQWRGWFSAFHHQNVRSQYHWTTCVMTFLLAVLLLVAKGFGTNREGKDTAWLIVEAIILFMSLVANIYLNLSIWYQERSETERLVSHVLEDLAKCINYNTWSGSCFTPLDSPQSPSMSLQWTLRDKQIVHLPNILLVKGDIIYLRPGQIVPARCKEIVDSSPNDESVEEVLNEGDIYDPEPDKEAATNPRARIPMKPKQFILLETPYIGCLRNLLQDVSRPASIIEHETFTIGHKWIERRLIPILLVVSIAINALRYMYLRNYVGHWTEMFITLQIQTILPLISVTLPVMWLVLNSYGQARVFAAFEAAKGSMSLCENSFDTDSSISADEARINLNWTNILDWFKSIVMGKAPAVTKKINIVHILGSVTSLCCVDKKGILSYPNPSPEKVFFLQKPPEEENTTELNDSDSPTENQDNHHHHHHHHRPRYEKKRKKTDPGSRNHSIVEVLDLTHDPKKQFGLDFDDPGWQQYLSSLKPLGLTILANTCNPRTVQWYSQFTDHVACAALENEETVAVINKSKCLCSLARQIGFSEKAVEIFKLEKTLGMYRQVSPETTTKERLQRAKSFVQNKIPMPNMVSMIVRETISGSCQLLSQGTAEILLSCCSDYWNGEDLTELTENDRKRITDFYHRTSIGSYCSAFSYRPITRCVSQSLSDMYLELPGDNQLFSAQDESLENNLIDEGVDIGSDSSVKGQQRSFSVDSLFDTSSIMSTEDAAGCFQSQCNQIFIGMVTMQYQARQDFIQLIDKLEGACIRFVHFSQENEVRSRVFSEKMGLEAGWNCHISLRSEKQYLSSINQSDRGNEGFSSAEVSGTTSRCSSRHPSDSKQKENNHLFENRSGTAVDVSRSAPSIINLGSSQVKFEKKVKATLVSPRKVRRQDVNNEYTVSCQEEMTLLNHEGDIDKEPFSECVIEFEEDLNVESDDGESRIASSYVTENTEDSLTGALDNRAKLPRGIENIRPHLGSVDNVPLLVNLFTDCTVETTCEMIAIMQEYGEVVLCVGSSLNIQNIPVFLLADCSLALEPWYPQVCLHSPYVPPNNHVHQSPSELAGSLLSVICPLKIGRKENISLVHLIAEARSHLMSMRTCFYFMLCCSLSVSLTQLLASTLLFPPVLAPQHLLWLVLFIIPLLSLTMMGNPVDARVMTLATRKNMDHITGEMLFRFIIYNLIRFVPPVLTALFCYCRTLLSFCYSHHASQNATSCKVYDFIISSSTDDGDWYVRFSGSLVVAQNILLFLLVLYFEIVSVSFVHWTDHIWQQCPATNKLWLGIIPVLLVCQILFFICDIYIRNGAVSSTLSLSDITPDVWAVGLAAPILFVVVNELVKHREIKLAVRYQKRARLDFGTKLGMNSPF